MAEFKFNPVKLAKKVLKNKKILYINFHFFIYKKSGFFQVLSDIEVYQIIYDLLGDKYRERWGKEIKHCLAAECYKEHHVINKDKNMINIKNGMFCLKGMRLFPHDPKYFSTIQLPVRHELKSACTLWIKTLKEIFEDKEWKIRILQEFMGYCLTSDVSHQKALINYGQGANGKSLIFRVFETILGRDNICAVPISQLDKRSYLAEMFGKLVNLSLESEANLEINDANFKSIVSGDLITVDEKYKKPFSFNPFCKLIFAMNTLPYVSDKTSAFYRRVLILSYDKEFSREEQNLNLFNDLYKEIDGIFLWMLEGLQRLNTQGHFTEDIEMIKLLEEYKRDNNPVLTFVEDFLCNHNDRVLPKKEIYKTYCEWSKDNGYKTASDKTLTKTISKHFTNGVKEYRTGSTRFWHGITWKTDDEQEKTWEN